MEINKISNIKISLGQSISDNNKKEQLLYKIKLNKYTTSTLDIKKLLEIYDINEEIFIQLLDKIYNDIISYIKDKEDYIMISITLSNKKVLKRCMQYKILEDMKKYGNNVIPLYELYKQLVGE